MRRRSGHRWAGLALVAAGLAATPASLRGQDPPSRSARPGPARLRPEVNQLKPFRFVPPNPGMSLIDPPAAQPIFTPEEMGQADPAAATSPAGSAAGASPAGSAAGASPAGSAAGASPAGSTVTPSPQAGTTSGVFATPTYPLPSDYSVGADPVPLGFRYLTEKRQHSGGFDVGDGRSETAELVIHAAPTSGLVPDRVDVVFQVHVGKARVPFGFRVKGVRWIAERQVYAISRDSLDEMAKAFVRAVNGALGGFDADHAITPADLMTLTLIPATTDHSPSLQPTAVAVNGSIRLTLRQGLPMAETIQPDPAPAPKPVKAGERSGPAENALPPPPRDDGPR